MRQEPDRDERKPSRRRRKGRMHLIPAIGGSKRRWNCPMWRARWRGSPMNSARLLRSSLSKDSLIGRSEEHTSELQSLMRISYAVFCLKKKNKTEQNTNTQYK